MHKKRVARRAAIEKEWAALPERTRKSELRKVRKAFSSLTMGSIYGGKKAESPALLSITWDYVFYQVK